MDLIGTEKQIAWAETIRVKAVELYPFLTEIQSAKFWIINKDLPARAIAAWYAKVNGIELEETHVWTRTIKNGGEILQTEEVKDIYKVLAKSVSNKIFISLYIGINPDNISEVKAVSNRESIPASWICYKLSSQCKGGSFADGDPQGWVIRIRSLSDVEVFPVKKG